MRIIEFPLRALSSACCGARTGGFCLWRLTSESLSLLCVQACINLLADMPPCCMDLGITLSRLDDFENACAAYVTRFDFNLPAPPPCTYSLLRGSFEAMLMHYLTISVLYSLENKFGLRRPQNGPDFIKRQTLYIIGKRSSRSTHSSDSLPTILKWSQVQFFSHCGQTQGDLTR